MRSLRPRKALALGLLSVALACCGNAKSTGPHLAAATPKGDSRVQLHLEPQRVEPGERFRIIVEVAAAARWGAGLDLRRDEDGAWSGRWFGSSLPNVDDAPSEIAMHDIVIASIGIQGPGFQALKIPTSMSPGRYLVHKSFSIGADRVEGYAVLDVTEPARH